MAPSRLHEKIEELLARLIYALCEEMPLPCQAMGSWTLQRQELERGLEPDKCFYVASEALVRGRVELDLSRDPPPDLAVEVDVTRKSLSRFPIYAALGVPEIWRYANGHIGFYRLREGGDYAEMEESSVFPGLAAAEVSRFLALRGSLSDSDLVRSLREWVRRELKRG